MEKFPLEKLEEPSDINMLVHGEFFNGEFHTEDLKGDKFQLNSFASALKLRLSYDFELLEDNSMLYRLEFLSKLQDGNDLEPEFPNLFWEPKAYEVVELKNCCFLHLPAELLLVHAL